MMFMFDINCISNQKSADVVEEVEGADIARGMGPYGDYSYGSYEYYYDAQVLFLKTLKKNIRSTLTITCF